MELMTKDAAIAALAAKGYTEHFDEGENGDFGPRLYFCRPGCRRNRFNRPLEAAQVDCWGEGWAPFIQDDIPNVPNVEDLSPLQRAQVAERMAELTADLSATVKQMLGLYWQFGGLDDIQPRRFEDVIPTSLDDWAPELDECARDWAEVAREARGDELG
jgi:hypothetical protein